MRKPTGRRRGGQPGNHNRLKHGLYAETVPDRHLIRLHRLGLDRSELPLALARARLKSLLVAQQSAPAKEFLTYERAIQFYLAHISRLLHRNLDFYYATGIPSHQLHELLEILKDL